MKFLLAALLTVLFAGCVDTPADPGSVSYQATTMGKDGREVLHNVKYTAPQNAAEGSSITFDPEHTPILTASFGKMHEGPEPMSEGAAFGQKILYGSSVTCFLLAAGLLFFGRHIKLAGLSVLAGVGLVGLAVFADQYPGYLVLMVGAGIVAIVAAFGWGLWMDYKDNQKFDFSAFGGTA